MLRHWPFAFYVMTLTNEMVQVLTVCGSVCVTIFNVDDPEFFIAKIDGTAKQLVTATAVQYVDQDTGA